MKEEGSLQCKQQPPFLTILRHINSLHALLY